MLLKNSQNNEVVVVKKVITEGNNVLTARYRDIDHYKRKQTDTTDWDQPKFEHIMCSDMEARMAATETDGNTTLAQAIIALGYSIIKEIRFKAEDGWADFDETLI